jgi:hypothetical protein
VTRPKGQRKHRGITDAAIPCKPVCAKQRMSCTLPRYQAARNKTGRHKTITIFVTTGNGGRSLFHP